MDRYRSPGLLMVAFMATYWAYEVIDALIGQFTQSMTYVDLVVIFVLGLIAGAAPGVALGSRRGKFVAG